MSIEYCDVTKLDLASQYEPCKAYRHAGFPAVFPGGKMKLLFVGHEDFGNRGCEALVRSITGIISGQAADTLYLVPSRSPSIDKQHWPDAAEHGVSFVGETLFARQLGWWGRVIDKVPALTCFGPPPFRLDPTTRAALEQSDGVIVTGGDILSLEYGLPSLFFWAGVAQHAMQLGKPVHIWAASIGPFRANPVVEKMMAKHLNRYTSITVRESTTRDYLVSIGVKDIALVTDPAFTMKPQPHGEAEELFAQAKDGVLGFNVSPLVRGFLSNDAAKAKFDAELVDFLRHILDRTDLSVLLVPHVDPFDGTAWNSDSAYMQGLLAQAGGPNDRLQMLSRELNAAELKYALSRCRYFIGARTHATIGALSQGVPTISIAYSVKAVGINRDLFGNEDYVLPTPQVSKPRLLQALDLLNAQEAQVRVLLAERIPLWRERAAEAAAPIIAAARADNRTSSSLIVAHYIDR